MPDGDHPPATVPAAAHARARSMASRRPRALSGRWVPLRDLAWRTGGYGSSRSRHGECEANLVAALRQQASGLGHTYTGDTGFLLHTDPDELVSPDMAFVRLDHLPPLAERIGYLRVVPDLVVEIRSPNDADTDVQAKVELYLRAGVQLVWLVDQRQQTVQHIRAVAAETTPTTVFRAEAGDVLDGGDVVPGFRLAVSEIFA